jgi:hypothetical protein
MPIRLTLKELFAHTIEFTEIRLDVVQAQHVKNYEQNYL